MKTEDKSAVEYIDLLAKCERFTASRDIKALGIYPYFHPVHSAPGDEVDIDGHKCIMIGSNNYLGLVNDPRVVEASADAVRKFGSGCTGSRLLNGTLDLHVELEDRLAKFMGKERALVFSTGFQTNLGTISCLAGKNDSIVIDRQDHACIVDGCRLSYGKTFKYGHNDMDELDRVLARVRSINTRGGILIIVDGVFSMEGDFARLPKIVELAKKYGARTMVDDAHAVGYVGATGAGTSEHFGLSDKVDIITGTFSKSFAALGGFVAGDDHVMEFVQHHARSLIFSASMTPSSAAAVLKVLDIVASEPERRERLWKNANRMLRELKTLGFDTVSSETPIIPIVIGEDMETFEFWKALFDNGLFTNPVVSPAVPPGQSLIRTSYTATHTDDQLDRVLEVLARIGREKGIIS